MYASLNLNTSIANKLGQADTVEPRAVKLFERAYTSNGVFARLLNRKQTSLLRLDTFKAEHHITHQADMGSMTVPLEAIRGTVNKSEDFDGTFRPTQRHSENRWVKVATAMLRGITLPPVELIKAGGVYYVKDGHHRISAAWALGYSHIDAVVTAMEVREVSA